MSTINMETNTDKSKGGNNILGQPRDYSKRNERKRHANPEQHIPNKKEAMLLRKLMSKTGIIYEKNNKIMDTTLVIPYNFQPTINALREQAKKFKILNSVDDNFKSTGFENITFCEFNEYIKSMENGTEKEKEVSKKMSHVKFTSGIKFALYNKYINKIQIVVDKREFLDYLNKNKESGYNELNMVIRHESIHVQQVEKNGKENYLLEINPIDDSAEYFNNELELEAWSLSLVDDLLMLCNYSKAEINDILETGGICMCNTNSALKKFLTEENYQRVLDKAMQYNNLELVEEKVV